MPRNSFRRSSTAAPTVEPVVFRRPPADLPERARRFVSLRWRVVLPLLLIALTVSVIAAFLLIRALAQSEHTRELDRLLVASRAAADRMTLLAEAQQTEAARIAYTTGIAPAAQSGNGPVLHALIEPLAAAADLDVVLVVGRDGREIAGLQRVEVSGGGWDYAVASGTDLTALLPGTALSGSGIAAGGSLAARSTLVRTGQDHMLVTAQPLLADASAEASANSAPVIGTVLVGHTLPRVLDTLRGGDAVELAIFGAEGEFLRTTLPFDDTTLEDIQLSDAAFVQALTTPGAVPVTTVEIGGERYNAAYLPFALNGTALGVVALYAPDDTLVATAFSRNLIAGLAALLVGGVGLVGIAVTGHIVRRVERVTVTARALADGQSHARTGLAPTDEIGVMGSTLDLLASRYAKRNDALQQSLRQQRTETTRLNAVLESIPDGLVVQDLDGRVLLINQAGRELLGGQRVFRSARLHELTAVVTDALGPALAPGLYALGDPTRIPLGDRVLRAQAAAITLNDTSGEVRRIGTVIVLRDITADVIRDEARERLMDSLAERAVLPTPAQVGDSLTTLAREMVHNTRSIQRTIADLRDLSSFDPRELNAGQRALAVNDLLWNIAAEWQPLVQVARMRLQVRFGPRGVYVLGDDRRLRWAVGNVLDNAVKYSPEGALIRLSARLKADDPNIAEIVVSDTGCGIAPDDLAQVFTRFYRGSPIDTQGQPIRKPGTGQGLTIARRVIEAHGGRIALASRVGAGTTAIIALPLTAPVTLELPPHEGAASSAASEAAPATSAPPIEDEIELAQRWFDTGRFEPIRPEDEKKSGE